MSTSRKDNTSCPSIVSGIFAKNCRTGSESWCIVPLPFRRSRPAGHPPNPACITQQSSEAVAAPADGRMPHGQAEPAIRRPASAHPLHAASANPLHVADPAEQQRGRRCRQQRRRQRRAWRLHLPSRDLRFDRAAQKRRGTDDEPREGGARGTMERKGGRARLTPRRPRTRASRRFSPLRRQGAGTDPASSAGGPALDNDAGRIAVARRGRRCARRERPAP